jgi:hypothetical protein
MRVMPAHDHRLQPHRYVVASLALAAVTAHAESRLAGQEGRAHARMNFQVVIPPRVTLHLTAAAHGHAVVHAHGNHGTAVVVKVRDTRQERRDAWVYTALAL